MKNNLTGPVKLVPVIIIALFVFILFKTLISSFEAILNPTVLTIVTVLILLPFNKEYKIINTLIGIVIFLYGLWFLSLIKTILIPFAVAIILAYISDPVVNFLQKKGMSRSTGALLLIGVIVLFFIIMLLFIIPTLAQEISSFVKELPQMRLKLVDWFNNLKNLKHLEWIKSLGEYEIPPYLEEAVDNLLHSLQESLSAVSHNTIEFVSHAFSGIIHLIIGLLELFIIPVFVFYMLEETSEIKKFFTSLVPPEKREGIFSITDDINQTLSTFLRGQLMNCTIIGTITAVAFFLIGIRFPVLLGFITGIMNFIPYVGNVIGPSPAILLALFTNTPTVSLVLVLITIAGLHLLDSYYLYPKVHGKSLKLSPLMIMMAVIIGGNFYGAPGMFLAIPSVCVLKVLFVRWVKRYEVVEEAEMKIEEKEVPAETEKETDNKEKIPHTLPEEEKNKKEKEPVSKERSSEKKLEETPVEDKKDQKNKEKNPEKKAKEKKQQ